MSKMIDEEYLKQVARKRKEWEEGPLKESLKRFNCTESTNKYYTPLDVKDFDFINKVGFPGQYPFTAGAYPCQVPGAGPVTGGAYLAGGAGLVRAGRYSGYGVAEDTRDYYRSEIKRGRKSGPNVAFDLPSQVGLDSDDPRARGEVGRTGVAFDTLADFEVLYEAFQGDNDIDKIASNWTINAPASVILAAYIVLAEKRGIPQSKLRGTPQNDILKEFIARGTYIFPPRHSMRLTRDTIVYVAKNMPSMNALSISGYHIREAGATAEQALGFALSDAIAYIQLGLDAGLDVDSFISRLSFNTLGGSMEIMREIACRRALRRMWAKIVKDRFGGKNPRNWALKEAGGNMIGNWTATKQRPLNNLSRSVIGGVAGALAGYIPSVEPPFDEALGLGWSIEAQQLSEDASRIIQYEAKLTEVTDPLAGSYYIEALTDKMEQAGWDIINKIDEMGGSVAAIENGYIPKAVAQSAYEHQKKLESREEIIVGVNAFTDEAQLAVMPARVVPHPYDPEHRARAEEMQIQKLNKVRKERDNKLVKKTLAQLREVARDEKANLMPAIIDAVRAYASMGEICGVFREVFGEYSGYGSI